MIFKVLDKAKNLKIIMKGYKMKNKNKFSSYYIEIPIGLYNNKTIYNIEKITSKKQEREINLLIKNIRKK